MRPSIVMVTTNLMNLQLKSQDSNDGVTGYEKICESMELLYISMVKVINQPEELHSIICFNNVMDQQSNNYTITFLQVFLLLLLIFTIIFFFNPLKIQKDSNTKIKF